MRSACARSIPAHRLAADLRPTSTSFRVAPALSRRQQTRHYRAWWSSPWDADHSRRHRALLQKYAKLRTEAWSLQWGPRHSFPPLMREMEKFEKWVRDLEAELTPQQTGKPHHRPQPWSEPCSAHAPSRRWGFLGARFQHTGRDGPHGPKGGSGSSSPGSHRSKDKPVERPRESDFAFQEEKVWTAASPESKDQDHYIDPVTNKRVPRPGQSVRKDVPGHKVADPVEPEPSTTAIHLGPGSIGAGTSEGSEKLQQEPVDREYPSEPPRSEAEIGKGQPSPSSTSTKDGSKTVKAIYPKSQSPVMQKADIDSASKGDPPSRGAEIPTKTRDQKEKLKMTGNYVKDFPEDFSETWTGRYHPETSVDKKPSTELLEPALSRTGEPSAVATPKTKEVEPAVERRTTHDELIEQIRDIYLDSSAAHEVIPPDSTPAPSQSPSGKPETSKEKRDDQSDKAKRERHPALYKILVYDPKTETVDAADATSVVPDDLGVLTPAEAVTKLSNPAKFLPHFAPLQARGYEIVSGEDDVLVFRKMRDATEPGTVFLRGTRHASLPQPKAASPAVNPIDMMGSESVVPNIGNFASPTGYANYGELEREEEGVPKRKPPPPFRDASEVDYEEKAKGRRRPGVLWRASVGAAWVVGLVWGGSVVGEYFVTGGENGKGSKGRLN